MQTVSRTTFTTVKTEGAILPAELLQRIAAGDSRLPGLTPADYHLFAGERLNEAINRSWNRCLGAWTGFDEQRQRLSESDAGTTLTRERWLLILFQELGYGRLQAARGVEIDGVRYPISHTWEQVPLHLVSFRQDLDRRGDITGAIKRSPHSLLQEFLNRSGSHLWGFVSNGLRLRILRDNASLTRLAYVEFDLEAMMAGELYADFSLLWLLCHQSRVENLGSKEYEVRSKEKEDASTPYSLLPTPFDCWLEQWSKLAAEQGTRALDVLRDGVQEAIAALGKGFLAHPANRELKSRLKSGELTTQDYYRQLLRLVYRLIFLFVAEDRDLLLAPGTPDPIRRNYLDYYSTHRLRTLAESMRGGPHADLYRGLRLLFSLLRDGYAPLGLPGLGSFLFSERATPDLDSLELANGNLLEAIRALALVTEGRVRRPVDYRNLGAEELGSVYESLLELHPRLNTDAATFELGSAAGSERKTTGSYYTPTSLINSLLDSALEPVVEDRLKAAREQGSRGAGEKEKSPLHPRTPAPLPENESPEEKAILSIKVVDPASGSGHFLIAAAHRLARHLARVRTGDEEPAPADYRAALRDVVRACIHGVDLNEMAVELCKVALWLETLDPGKPLSFLDRNIQCGNSLIGATPALLDKGIPDEAFTPIEGDDKAYCVEFKKKNKQQRSGQLSLFTHDLQPWNRLGNLAASMLQLDILSDDTLAGVRQKQAMYEQLVRSDDYEYGQLWADAWCAAFVWRKMPEKAGGFPYPITEEVFRHIESSPFRVEKWLKDEIKRLRQQYGFFHWHLAFPHVFRLPGPDEQPENEQTGWNGGFDAVLGNPPWERIKLQEKEWFATRRPDIADAANAALRRKMIEGLIKEDPATYNVFQEDRRQAEGEGYFIRSSGRYPLCGRGDVNTYAVFAELARTVQSDTGRVGIIVPSGIATDDTTKFFFQALIENDSLVSLYSFENEEFIFPSIHHATKFCLLTLTGQERPQKAADFVFFARQVSYLQDKNRHFTLSAKDLALLNPNTRTCPIFRSQHDAELTKAIYRRVPVLIKEGPPEVNLWDIGFLRMIDMANDSGLFRTRERLEAENWHLEGNTFLKEGQRFLPLYEGKMFWHFDHRFGTYEGQTEAQANQGKLPELDPQKHANPLLFALPRYWIEASVVVDKQIEKGLRPYYVAFRDITSAVVLRTAIFSIIPGVAVGHTAPLVVFSSPSVVEKVCFVSCLNSFVLDYIARQSVGGSHLTYSYLKQFAIIPPNTYAQPCPWHTIVSLLSHSTLADWILPRVLELTYTAWDLQPFAQDCGYDGPPFRWDEARRFLLRCELDATYFHLYGIAREDVDYIMDTFPIVKRKDEAAHGEYRTKRVILEIYDEMQRAMESGEGYQTRLDPPPGDRRVAHAQRGE